jgi:hypothetical protein
MQKAATINHVHPSGVGIDMNVRAHGQRGGMCAPFLAGWILGVDKTSDL